MGGKPHSGKWRRCGWGWKRVLHDVAGSAIYVERVTLGWSASLVNRWGDTLDGWRTVFAKTPEDCMAKADKVWKDRIR